MLLIATTNLGKLREFRTLIDPGVDLRSLEGLAVPVVEESADSFVGNARLKAEGYAKATGLWTLADDSGLEVKALGGKPGVHSARFAEIHDRGTGDAANINLLLEMMRDVPDADRRGRFVCVLALASPQGSTVLVARGEVEGLITRHPVGGQGFGYDPIFFHERLGKTFGQLSPQEKEKVSHRASAAARLKEAVASLGGWGRVLNPVPGRV
jgi:XTP/dITP diphosphohydrolase